MLLCCSFAIIAEIARIKKAAQPRIRITASPYGTPGEAVAVKDGLVVWADPLEEVAEAWPFGALFCHDDDEERLRRFVATGQLEPKPI